ncbi:MAG TPA: hypothetical protein DCP07_06440 [Lachnospiraceae bacterium]|nr:hypothetical protein [Lachnospiraceae bacterium]
MIRLFRNKNRILMLLLVSFLCLTLASCGKKKGDDNKDNAVDISFLNKNHTGLETTEFVPKSKDQGMIIQEVIEQMHKSSKSIDRVSPLSLGSDIVGVYVDNGQATINMDAGYYNLSPTDEILIRAALVRTFTQVNGVDGVSITIMSVPLEDTYGNPVGSMNADMFLDNEGEEINNYTETIFQLYFATLDGQYLDHTTRTVRYNTNNSLEKVVVEELIKGPKDGDIQAVINPDTRINSVTTTDGICYVDLSEEFMTPVEGVRPEVTIYALVNSLSEISDINKVQILINGESSRVYGEVMDLNTLYERNLDMVVNEGVSQ